MIYWVLDGKIAPLTPLFLEYIFTYYLPKDSLVVPYGFNLENIDKTAYSHVFYDCSTNPVIYSASDHNILTGSYTDKSTGTFFPFWAVWASLAHAPAIENLNYNFIDKEKKYKISCLNGTPWAHRKLTYLELSSRTYFNDIVFTFHQSENYQPLSYEESLTPEEQLIFNQLPTTVAFEPNDSLVGIDLSLNHSAYQDSLINLVTETTVNPTTPFLSEKTFKPIIAGQLFVVIAAPGAVEFLRSIGIDTFDDIIDHSYDTVTDLRLRIKLAITQIDRLVQLNQNILYSTIKPRLLKNSQYLRSQSFRDQFKLTFD